MFEGNLSSSERNARSEPAGRTCIYKVASENACETPRRPKMDGAGDRSLHEAILVLLPHVYQRARGTFCCVNYALRSLESNAMGNIFAPLGPEAFSLAPTNRSLLSYMPSVRYLRIPSFADRVGERSRSMIYTPHGEAYNAHVSLRDQSTRGGFE